MTPYRIGIDVGGTYTDLVARDAQGAAVFVKSPSTPSDQSTGVLVGLSKLAARLGMTRAELLAGAERIVHGTTVATNALIERKGALIALLTTAGHRDILEMREGLKDHRYDIRSTPPDPLVPRRLRLPVRERIRPDGRVLTPLDLASLEQAIVAIRRENIDAIAVCYLHAYRNPAHERQTAELLHAALPDVFVSISSEVHPQIKEYERVCTTVVNGYVGPPVKRYLTRLEQLLAESGFGGDLLVMLSHGGVAPVEEAWRTAAATVLSGPAGGMAAAQSCAAMLAVLDLIPLDMGGTSTDISLVADGQSTLTSERGLAGQRIALRRLDIMSIGAGGGSIASVDAGMTLKVGPDSAGAEPGPACYGAGGNAPTVTDANVLLGLLDPSTFADRPRPLDPAASARVIGRLAATLGLSPEATAHGIYRLVNLNMAEGVRSMTLRRGIDPRRFALLSFGGAAGLHAVEVARELEIGRVIVPRAASVLSAWGMLGSELRYEIGRTQVGQGRPLDDDAIRAVYSELEAAARSRLASWHAGEIGIERFAEMRYGEQVFEIELPLQELDWHQPSLRQRIDEAFHRYHEALYTYALPSEEVVFVNARVVAVSAGASAAEDPPPLQRSVDPEPVCYRNVYLDGWCQARCRHADALRPGDVVEGPAIIDSETTSVLLGRADRATSFENGWLDITVGAR